jgi:hypothetical protein
VIGASVWNSGDHIRILSAEMHQASSFASKHYRETSTSKSNSVMPKSHKPQRLEQRPPFERIALLLQGGGALGSYQGGVYQALAEANLHPDWVAGISMGAVNSALIAGNPPERRVEKPREFWEAVSTSPLRVVGGWMPYDVAGRMLSDQEECPAQNDVGHIEVDDNPGYIDKRGHKWGRGAGRVEAEPLRQERQHRPR